METLEVCQTEAKETQEVSLDSLSKLVGCPTEFIKKELLLDGEDLSMEELRSSVAKYLLNTMKELD